MPSCRLASTSAVVKQRSTFGDGVEIDEFPEVAIGRVEAPKRPAWALDPGDLPRRQ
jgi:hypothetical protein